jgi:hypothetical protein
MQIENKTNVSALAEHTHLETPEEYHAARVVSPCYMNVWPMRKLVAVFGVGLSLFYLVPFAPEARSTEFLIRPTNFTAVTA